MTSSLRVVAQWKLRGQPSYKVPFGAVRQGRHANGSLVWAANVVVFHIRQIKHDV